MYYKPLRHIFRSSEQKLLLGLSQANLIGGAAGGFVALMLTQRFHFLPLLPVLGLHLVAGIAVTFRYRGWPIYLHLYRAARYNIRHLLRPSAYDIDTTTFIRPTDDSILLLPELDLALLDLTGADRAGEQDDPFADLVLEYPILPSPVADHTQNQEAIAA